MDYDITEEDWLTNVTVARTTFMSGDLNPKYIVVHSTRGRTFDEAVNDWQFNEMIKESMHLVVAQGGWISQMAPFTKKVWHCGASYYQGHAGMNNWSIGIAVESPPDNGKYSKECLKKLDVVIPLIVATYNIRDIVPVCSIEQDVADSNYDFPIDRYWPYVRYGNADSLGRFAVTTPSRQKLNVRGGPNVHFEVIDKLSAGDCIKVLRYEGSWAFIIYDTKTSTHLSGWVHESFIRRL